MQGKVCLVTGANRGIGKATAEQLARAGATVVMLGRDRVALEDARAEVAKRSGNGSVFGVRCDLASQASIRLAAADVLDRWPRLDVLVHNAAIARAERHLTEDGVEESLAVNHLAPYLMTALMLPRLRETPGARIVQATTGAFPPTVDPNGSADPSSPSRAAGLDDIQMERAPYDAWSAYRRSKLVNLAWALDLGRRLRGSGVTMNAVLPGAFVRTDATREFPTGFRLLLTAMKPFMMSAAAAARNVVRVATAPELAEVSGELFMKGKTGGEPALARDPEVVKRVRDLSARLTGVDA